jgi:hypothetical protein
MIVTVGRIARWRAYSADGGTNRGMEVATYNLAYPSDLRGKRSRLPEMVSAERVPPCKAGGGGDLIGLVG